MLPEQYLGGQLKLNWMEYSFTATVKLCPSVFALPRIENMVGRDQSTRRGGVCKGET